ncbi:MAG TPA: hypothetical protein VFW59_05110 [Gallionella sp.]|nr:hypothetical protein [Gallionella sp.]
MIETATIITLCLLYLIFFRPGKTPPLENPLVIERAGQYHMTLAPQLNLAQPFVEEIARQVEVSSAASSASQFFAVCDKQVTAHGYDFYLLAVTQRDGMLFFQAARPVSREPESELHTIGEFADKVLARFPDGAHDVALDDGLRLAVQRAAQLRGVELRRL